MVDFRSDESGKGKLKMMVVYHDPKRRGATL
jgi:hypothetical protein